MDYPKIPESGDIKRILYFGLVRILVTLPLIGMHIVRQLARLILYCSDISIRVYEQSLITPLDYSLWGIPEGGIVKKESKILEIKATNDILSLLEGKHALIIGGTGEGKSTLAQYLAALVGGKVKVYDPDASPSEWTGFECVGREGNFEAIQASMESDLEDLERRLKERGRHGDSIFLGRELFIIAEEFPLLKDEVEIAIQWLLKHARRGRKPKRFICILSQESEVRALGLEGQGGARKNLAEVLTNKEAIKRAKKLKNLNLVEWLKSNRSRVLVEQLPVQLPDIREIEIIIRQSQRVLTPSTTEIQIGSDNVSENELEPLKNRSSDHSEIEENVDLTSEIKDALKSGRSVDWIAKHIVMEKMRIGYPKARAIIETVSEKFD